MIILFDLDSTLSKIEGFDEIARKKGVYDQVAKITAETMEGNIPFSDAFARKLDILKPSISDALWLSKEYEKHFEDGAENLVKKLKEKNINVGILSNNLDIVIKKIGNYLNLDGELCIGVKAHHDKHGEYIGLDASDPLTKDGGKGEVIKSFKLKRSKLVFVGDSKGDMDAGDYADLFIGYGGVVARDKVKKNAKYFANNMNEVSKFIENFLGN